ncbi:MAG TPA: bifunctional diaminohydroxyphosphoribosylaminopyrimidine deaminase/5-amino-6-(5-phosphoribosylamino)uracil reductase RibD, partial [Thermodesulfobacteriota bacterium]|nr:bifunctional diaminohydroxyphosphoribosylaminopyrimidine deaminase/5-amino-6-(5-phosphoribosylamino)uracil reductase RibD [Thermodesulfobacteriota bacterium]
MEADHHYMKMALQLARKGLGRTSPNPMVGAVVVYRGKVVGKGFHHQSGFPHAEREALAMAGEKARGATLYVNLEPCNHYGKTPPCTEGILEKGIKRVVFGMADPNPKVAGGGEAFLRSRGLDVVS